MVQHVPIPTLHLFPELNQALVNVLASLSGPDWNKPTLAAAWTVRDVAAHLLDVNIRTLSTSRDGHFEKPEMDIEGFDSLVAYLNALNMSWVKTMKRVSPPMLIELLQLTNKLHYDHLSQLPPFGRAIFPVAWAGEDESQNWFHIAREYTEKWHHQQQIRHAAGDMQPLLKEVLYQPYLDTSFRALPYHFKDIPGKEGDAIQIIVRGENQWVWNLARHEDMWSLQPSLPTEPATKVVIDDIVAWRIFSRQISREELMDHTIITGNQVWANHLLRMKAVMV